MDEKQFNQLIKRLDVIARLLSLSLPKDIDQNRKITILYDSGMQPKEIAVVLGITANAVSIVLHRMKKKKGSTESTEVAESV